MVKVETDYQKVVTVLNNYIHKLETAMMVSDDPQVCAFDFASAWIESKKEAGATNENSKAERNPDYAN